MSRTTVMAGDELLDELRAIAREEGISLGAVIRQGMEWRARTRRRVPSFIGSVRSGEHGHNTAERAEELVTEYLREKHARR